MQKRGAARGGRPHGEASRDRETLKEFLGGIQVRVETEVAERVKRPGVAVGLAWTPAGGDILFIEANKMKGKGGFTMTGHPLVLAGLEDRFFAGVFFLILPIPRSESHEKFGPRRIGREMKRGSRGRWT